MNALQQYFEARKALESADARTAGIAAALDWSTSSTTIALRYRDVIARGLALVDSRHANAVNAAKALVADLEAKLS